MYDSDSSSYRNWLENLAESTPELIVLSSRKQSWAGLDVALLRYDSNQIAAPAFSSYLIAIHLDNIPGFVGEIDGQIYEAEVRKGEASILSTGLGSEWQWQKKGQCDSLHLAIEAAFVHQIANENGYVNADRIEIMSQFLVPDPLFQHIGLALKAELEAGGLTGRLFAESLATALAVRLLKQYSTKEQRIREPEGGLSRQNLRLVIDYINAHLSGDIRLADIAAVVGISSSHLTRLFKQSTGVTPYQYVIQYRVERARALLQRGNLTLAEIATLVGFNDQSHLTYHFKRIVGTTPKRFLQK